MITAIIIIKKKGINKIRNKMKKKRTLNNKKSLQMTNIKREMRMKRKKARYNKMNRPTNKKKEKKKRTKRFKKKVTRMKR